MRRLSILLAALTALLASGSAYLARAGAAPLRPHGSSTEISGMAYTDDDGQLLGMDVYEPSTRQGPAAPVVLVVHGGGWSGGDRADVRPEAEALAAAGFVAVAPDYRLATDGHPSFPNALVDLESARSWIIHNAAVLGADPSRMGAFGVSAGGNLALDLGVRNLVKAAVSWSGPTDLAAFEGPGRRCTTASCGPLSLPYAVYRYLGCLPEHCPDAYRAASPRDGLSGARAAFLVWNSTDELVPRDQADGFSSAARSAGVRVVERILAGHLHAAQYMDRAMPDSLDFLDTALG